MSPINTLHSEGAPGVFVMSHVGLLDRQVFAYESFKWIQRLRGTASWEERDSDPKGKYVTFEKKEAHQYRPQSSSRFRAMDLAILDAWAEGRLRWSGGGLFDPDAYKIMSGSNIKMSNSAAIPPMPIHNNAKPNAMGGSRRNRSRRSRKSEGGSRKLKSRRNRSEGGKRKARKAKKSKKSRRGGERKSRKERKNKRGGSRKNKSRRSRRNE